MSPAPDILMSAGEPSGDRLAARLGEALLREAPELRLAGLAGPMMREAGVAPVAEAELLGVMGVVEVLGALGRVRRARAAMREALERRPRAFVAVDAPEFNLPLARRARRLGVPVLLLGSPQVWAWRPGRARDIAALAAEVICLLPFEPELYHPHGGRARFVGHLGLEGLGGPATAGQDWAVLPGSRTAELRRLLPEMVGAARRLARQRGGQVRLSVAPGVALETIEGLVDVEGLTLVEGVAPAVEGARVALVTSGTATLEVACLGCPMVVCYRVHPLTYAVGRLLVKGVEHFALPNLLLSPPPCPELLQDFGEDALMEAVDEALATPRDRLMEVRRLLRPEGAASRAAEVVLEHLRGGAS